MYQPPQRVQQDGYIQTRQSHSQYYMQASLPSAGVTTHVPASLLLSAIVAAGVQEKGSRHCITLFVRQSPLNRAHRSEQRAYIASQVLYEHATTAYGNGALPYVKDAPPSPAGWHFTIHTREHHEQYGNTPCALRLPCQPGARAPAYPIPPPSPEAVGNRLGYVKRSYALHPTASFYRLHLSSYRLIPHPPRSQHHLHGQIPPL